MKRRQLLLGLGTTAGVSAALGTGAFSSAAANRQMTVSVADDADGLLALEPGEGPNGEYADDTGDRLQIAFGEGSTGLTSNSVYAFDDTFEVVNHGTQPVYVWTEVTTDAFTDEELYLYHSDRTAPLDESAAAEVAVGNALSLGVYVDTGAELDTYTVDLTVRATAEPPGDGEGGSQPGEGGDDEGNGQTERIDPLVFDSTAGLLGADGPLADDAVVVAAESTATSVDEDGNGDAEPYGDGESIPLVAADGGVLAFGVPFGTNDTDFGTYGNEEFLRNALVEFAESGTACWDESHDQFYTLDSFSTFAEYAEEFDFQATTDLTADLGDADVAVVTSPSDAFDEAETDALADFVADGGRLVLMDQSDYSDYDETGNLNDLAAAVGTDIRFNDNQVVDEENNAGAAFTPVTENFNDDEYPELFEDRSGLGLELDTSETYEVEVVSVADGDTVDVEFPDGAVDTVRTVGHDTPETGASSERPAEWEGIDDPETLAAWGSEATSFAEEELGGATVTLSFDENEGLRGNYGRLIGFLEVDGDLYNETVIRQGYARVYDSGLGRHDEFWSAEADARANGRGLWADSDVESTPPVRNDPVSELFFPDPTAITADGGSLADDRVPVRSEAGDPLVGVDESARLAVVGGPLVDESFHSEEGGPGVEPFGNEAFLTNLIDDLTAEGREGDILIDGGHGQFAADYALSAEDAAHYGRYLEGQGIGFEATNDYGDEYGPDLADARALVVTAPSEAFDDGEISEIESFVENGGAVVLTSSGADAADTARSNLDSLAAALGSDLRTGSAVTDDANNLGGPQNPTTTNFDDSGPLFAAYGSDSGESSLVLEEVVSDPDGDPIDDEYVAFTNDGDASIDLSGYTVADEADNSYTFDSLMLGPGETVKLYSGDGQDTATERYWGNSGVAVWNNGGDTVIVADPDGTTVIEESYSG
ncbi:DUF4350 domain-containing protein [Halosimplex sp. J119]